MRAIEDPNIVSTATLSRRVGISEPTLRKLALDGTIPAMRIGKDFRFHYDEVLAALTAGTPRSSTSRGKGRRSAPVRPNADAPPRRRGRPKRENAA